MASKKITFGEIFALILLGIYFLFNLGDSGFIAIDEKYLRAGWAILILIGIAFIIFDWLKDNEIDTNNGMFLKYLRHIAIFLLLAGCFFVKVIQ